jgi:hypothetical protein
MDGKRPLDADAKRLLADGEGLPRAGPATRDHDALEHLRPAPRALDHLEVNPHPVPGGEARHALQLALLDAVDDRAHGVEFTEGAKKKRPFAGEK